MLAGRSCETVYTGHTSAVNNWYEVHPRKKDNNPTILEECQLCMHVDHKEKILYDSYIIELDYDPTYNHYERGKYGCINFPVTRLLLVMLSLSMFYFSPMHMLDTSCLDNLFAYKIPMHRKYVRLKCVCHVFYDALFAFQLLSFILASMNTYA